MKQRLRAVHLLGYSVHSVASPAFNVKVVGHI